MPKIALQFDNGLSQPEFPGHSHLRESVETRSILRSMCAIGAVGMLPMQSLHGDHLVIISTIEDHQPMKDKANAKGCSKIQNAEALVNILKNTY